MLQKECRTLGSQTWTLMGPFPPHLFALVLLIVGIFCIYWLAKLVITAIVGG